MKIRKTAEIVAGHIRRRIVTGEIATGDNLPVEPALMETFEVSRPTIREAIRILEFEGLISISQGARRGAKVEPPGTQFLARALGVALQSRAVTLRDVFEARSIIEPSAARFAAERRPRQASTALRAHIAYEFEAIKEKVVIPAVTAEFHHILLRECGNQTLGLMATALHGLVEKHQTLAHRKQPYKNAEIAQGLSRLGVRSHAMLADLIEKGDGAAAEQHWRKHMEATGRFYLEKLSTASVVDIMDE